MKKRILIPGSLLILYIAIGVFESFSVTINQTDKISEYVIDNLCPLVVVLGAITTFWTVLSHDRYKYKKVKIALNSIVYVCLFSLLHFGILQGYISLINRKVGEQQIISVTGIVTDISSQTSSGTTRYYLTVIEDSGHVIKLKVPQEIVKTYHVYEDFTLIMTRGSLGFLYVE